MMLYPSMSELLERVDNRYLLVNLVSRRARQLVDEAEDMGMPIHEKPVKTAINEVHEGKVSIVRNEGAQGDGQD